ncbi:hypothetical protein ACFQ0D_34065, partial [Micromonospora zhanjiangensis]
MNGTPADPCDAPRDPTRVGCLAVGIDLGTTNTKVTLVAVGESDLRVRAVAAAPTPEPRAVRPVLLGLLGQ